jgi:uncharacterized protein
MIVSGLILGAVLGVVLQRGRFCVTGMLRDIWLSGTYRNLVALLVVIAVHAVGLAALTSTGVITPDYATFAPAAVIVGGLIFGLGIILAGGCASGTWYRSGEGLVGSWIALVMYAVSAAAMKYGPLAGFDSWMKSWDTGLTTVPEALGVSPWWFALALALATVALVRHFLLQDAAKPKVSLNQPWYKKPLHMYTAGAIVGLIGVIAWPLSAATGRNAGLGITTPTADTLTYATTADPARLNWGTLLVLGLLVGSFIAAKATGEFRVRVPDAKTSVRSVWGGLMMGVGASLAGGCTVGNGMVETSLFSFKGWIAMVFIFLGVGLGAKLWIKPKSGAATPTTAAPAAGTYSTPQSLDHGAPANPVDPITPPTGLAGAGNLAVATGLISMAPRPTVSEKVRTLSEGRYALDTMGAVCPFPLVEAKDVMNTLQPGEELVIAFDCTQATDSIPQWAADDGHSVSDFHQNGDAGWEVTLVKGG